MIELQNISKSYVKGTLRFTALEKISFKINKGDFCSVIGPSGAGKSTLLYIIGGLIHPDSGTILFNGSDIYRLSSKIKNLYRKIHTGFIFQQFHLMPYLTVRENIQLNCHSKEHLGQIDHYLDKCSLIDMRKKYPSELSVGEKQRTAFIRAIISKPDILLADEPTGNLDIANSKILMDLIQDYNRNNGTVILVSHNMNLGKYANVRIKLANGRIQQ